MAATTNLFNLAKPIEQKKTGKAKKDNRPQVNILGLKKLAKISTLQKALDALYASTEDMVKDQMAEYFVETGEKNREVPVNFRGVEDTASASCELRKRSSRSVLTDEEVDLLETNKVPYETIVDVPECYVINPAYSKDKKLLMKVSAALANIDLPPEFIQLQPAVTRKVVGEESLKAMFETRNARELLSVVGTLAVKPTIEEDDSLAEKLENLLED